MKTDSNPGSDYAKAMGCLCSGIDRDGDFWLTYGCPIHSPVFIGMTPTKGQRTLSIKFNQENPLTIEHEE